MTDIRYQRSENFVFRKIVNEMILVPIKGDIAEMEHIFTLNEVGAFIWDELAEPRTLAELETAILDTFEADPQVVQRELQAFLEDLETFDALDRSH